ncbi:glycoside hydrolase family 25 protein [Stakelama marina]|uniref:glycoside hydrolase family 25 protein n=1 Tax=Stakelama marina TaxID=2826939 RepID=UPI0024C399E3|nr:GH25 family lysozyme [Stakelama marina]
MRRLFLRIVAVAIALGLIAAAAWLFATRWHPSPEDYPIQGVDVSARNGSVDWHMVHARGADFAYALATSGANDRDAQFERNWSAIADAGMRRGAMHRFSLCDTAEAQAANFVRTVPRTRDALPSALELAFDPGCSARPDPQEAARDVATFLTLTERHMGKPMVLEISPAFDAQYHLSSELPRTIWAERFFFRPSYPAKPWRMWRASTIRRVDGADGPINWDVVAP